MNCSNCGTENKEGYRFCANCGSPIEPARPDEGIRGHRQQKVTTTSHGEEKPNMALVVGSFFIPGLGHFVNGNSKKGAMLLGGAFLLALTGIGYLLVGVYSAYDVYKTGGRA